MLPDPYTMFQMGLKAPTRRRRRPDEPELTPEQERSLMEPIISGLTYLGGVLDTTGASARGAVNAAMGGRFGSPLDYADPMAQVGGREVWETSGLAPANKEGFHPIDEPVDAFWDAMGFGTEVFLDPIMLFTGPLGAVTKAGKAASQAAGKGMKAAKTLTEGIDAARKTRILGTTPKAITNEIRAGERGVVSLRVPIPGAGRVVFGAGSERAAKVAEKIYYGKLSPVRGWRQLFGKRLEGVIEPEAQMAKDLAVTEAINAGGAVQNTLPAFSKRMDELESLWKRIGEDARIAGDEFGFRSADEFLRYAAEARSQVEQGASLTVNEMQKLFHVPVDAVQKGEAAEAFARQGHELIEQMGRVMKDPAYEQFRALGGRGEWLDDLYAGHFPRRPKGRKQEKAYERMMAKRMLPTDNPFASRRAFHDVPEGTLTINRASRDELLTGTSHGWVVGKAGEKAIIETPKGSFGYGDLVHATDRDNYGRILSVHAKANKARVHFLNKETGASAEVWLPVDLLTPVSTEKATKLAGAVPPAPPKVHNKGLLDTLRDELSVYGIDVPKTKFKNASKAIQNAQEELAFQKYLRPAAIRSGVDPRTPEGAEALHHLRHGTEAVKDESGKIIEEARLAPAKTLVEHLRKQPKETLNTGLFNRTIIEDWADYAEHTAIATANLRAMHGFLRQAARLTDDPELDEVPLMTAWQSVRSRGTKNREGRRLLEDRGATTFAREYGEQLAKKGQEAPDEFKALFPQGWQGTDEQIEQLLGSVHVPAKTADVMAKYIDIAGPEARSFLGEIYDKYMSAFKFGVTAAPAFHVRNLIDGQWRNYCLSGPDTFPILGKNGLVRAMRDWSKYLKGNKDAVEPEFVKMLEQAHLVEGKGSLVQVLDREAVDMGGDIPQGGFTSIFDPLRPSNWEKGESWNPLNLAGFRAQQRTIKDAKGIERKVDWSKQFAPAEVHNNTFRYVESMNRHPAMLAMLRNGMDPATAKHMIMRTQYDYSKMSPFERKVMRRVFPFWGFLSNNIPYQMSQLFNYPGGKTAITLRAMNALHGELGSNLPSWMTEGFAMKIPEFLGGKDEESGKTQVLRKLGLSLEDLGNISMQGHMPSQRTFQRFLANASPAVTLPIKHVFDIDPYSGRSTRDMKGLTGDPWLDSLIYASPASRVIRTGEMLGQDLPAWQKALNLASGVKIGGYELDQLRDLDDRRILLDTLKKNPNIGFAEHPYLNRAGKEAADEDAQASIRLLKQITQRISQRAKERRDREARG